MRAAATLALTLGLLAASGCDDETTTQDGGRDLGAGDDQAVGDSGHSDLLCTTQQFLGFQGMSPSERRVDCSCGCTIDPFTGPSVSGIWTNVSAGMTTFTPMAGVGLSVTADGQSAIAIAALNSLNPASRFFIEGGDFDLLIDYQIVGTPPRDGHVVLTIEKPMPAVGESYTLERERTGDGTDNYKAALGGIQPVRVATNKMSGTLQLSRTGFTLEARADGVLVTQHTGAIMTRLAIALAVAVNGCLVDGGTVVPDGGSGCALTAVWKNLRMTKGSLVDRP